VTLLIHFPWLSESTAAGQQALFDDIDAHPLMSRCVKFELTLEDCATEILAVNPFQNVKSERAVDKRRRRFIAAELIESLIHSCRDVELRAIIALNRWGGLRTPSEPVELQWIHVDWARLSVKSLCPTRVWIVLRLIPAATISET
jgi:hypothetical protein